MALIASVLLGGCSNAQLSSATTAGLPSQSTSTTGVIAAPADSGQITKDSTCAEYLVQEPAERDTAIKRIGLQLHVRGTGSPLMLPEVDYECGDEPGTSFGTVVGRQHGY